MLIHNKDDIRGHIYNFYRNLFGTGPVQEVGLNSGFWSSRMRVSEEDNLMLAKDFTDSEILQVIKDLPVNSAPGPDGFSTFFYKEFWELIKHQFSDLIRDFARGNLDMKRLNYEVISLIPKIKEANSIKHFRPICLLNVSFKILTKLLANRLGQIADKLVNDC